jgi:hypothetical protein
LVRQQQQLLLFLLGNFLEGFGVFFEARLQGSEPVREGPEPVREGPEPVREPVREPVKGNHYHQQPKELLVSSVMDSNLLVSVFVLVVFFQVQLQPLFQLQLQLLWLQLLWL